MQTLLKEPLPSDIQAAFDVFRSTPRQSLGRQQELREIVLAAEKMFQELTTDYLITILSLYRMPVYPARWPGVTYHERETFLQYLSSQVSITRFPLWWRDRRLKKHHRAMTITNKEDLEAHEDVQDLRREKNTEKYFEWVFARTRNPRDDG
jgi:hypothetical protein